MLSKSKTFFHMEILEPDDPSDKILRLTKALSRAKSIISKFPARKIIIIKKHATKNKKRMDLALRLQLKNKNETNFTRNMIVGTMIIRERPVVLMVHSTTNPV